MNLLRSWNATCSIWLYKKAGKYGYVSKGEHFKYKEKRFFKSYRDIPSALLLEVPLVSQLICCQFKYVSFRNADFSVSGRKPTSGYF